MQTNKIIVLTLKKNIEAGNKKDGVTDGARTHDPQNHNLML